MTGPTAGQRQGQGYPETSWLPHFTVISARAVDFQVWTTLGVGEPLIEEEGIMWHETTP